MPAGIRATIQFGSADVCSIARVTRDTGATVDSVSTSVSLAGADGSTREFCIDDDIDYTIDDPNLHRIFTHGGRQFFRLQHESGPVCPCEVLGEFHCPIDRYVARDGSVTISFYTPDFEELRLIVQDLRERWPALDVKRLIRSPGQDSRDDLVLVDRSKLTNRQLEILQTAYNAGYFDRPRQANASEIAHRLGIDPSTFTEHLVAAQAKLFEDVLEEM